MSRTQGRFEQKLPSTDGFFTLTLKSADNYGAGVATKQRNAKGDMSFNVGASQACIFMIPLEDLIFRTGMLPFIQQQFGTAASVAGPTSVANTSDPDASIGAPPQTGINSITPQTGFVPKGLKILDITLKYVITGAALTTHTIGFTKTVFSNNAAIVVTDILANAANGLATATQANPYVTKVPINSPTFTVSDLTDLWIEIDATTQGGGSYKLYGATVHVAFNYN